MAAFLIILGIPILGVLLYVSEHYRRNAGTPGGRFFARGSVLLNGVVVGLGGITWLGLAAIEVAHPVFNPPADHSWLAAIFVFVTQVTVGLTMLWASISALRVFRIPVSTDHTDEVRYLQHERATESLRLSSALLMFIPMLLLGVFGVFVALPLVLWGVAFWTSRRAREAQFLWTMALAVRQDLPLAEEVDAFAQPLWARQKAKYFALSGRLRDGRSLGDALEMSTGILPRAVSTEIRAAEEAGTLPEVLSSLATDYTTSLNRNRSDSSLAVTLVYAWALLATLAVITTFIMYWIIPKYKSIFEDFGVELPDLTVSLINVADFTSTYFGLLLMLMGVPFLAAIGASIVYFVGWSNLNLPLLMRWFPRRDASSLLRSLSHAVGASQPLPEVVEEMSHRHLRNDMRGRLGRLSSAMQRGEPIWQPLTAEGFIFAKEADALASAQRAGNLPWAMRTLADGIERGTRQRAQFWLELIKPMLIVVIGVAVGWFVLAMFLPLVQLINALA